MATHGYDKADRAPLAHQREGRDAVSSFQYSGSTRTAHAYDANGNRLIQVETNGGHDRDDDLQLRRPRPPGDRSPTRWTRPIPNGRVVSYGYDAVGNRIRETEKDSADAVLADKQGIFDNANRLTELARISSRPRTARPSPGTQNGNQLTKTTAGVTTENRYDLRDKLVEVVQGAVHPRPLPVRLRRTAHPEDRRRGPPAVRLRPDVASWPSTTRPARQKAKYDYGSDRLICLTRSRRRPPLLLPRRPPLRRQPHGRRRRRRRELPPRYLGQLQIPDRARPDSKNRFAFTGHIFDTETGLYNAKARYFDPKLGQIPHPGLLPRDQIDEPAEPASVPLRERQPNHVH